MRDEQALEEQLFHELDAMYKRIADLERHEERSEHDRTQYRDERIIGRSVSSPKKGFLSPKDKTEGMPEKQLKERLRHKKTFSRFDIFATTLSLFLSALIVSIGIITRPIIFPRDSKKNDTPPVIEAIPSASEQHPSLQSPIRTEIRQKIEKMPEKTKVSAGLMISDDHLPQKRYYAIQVGAFRNLNYTHDCVERVKKIDPHVYYITTDSKNRGILYKVFVGNFLDRDEATNFIKEKKICNYFPDNFIQEFLLSEAKQ